MLFKNVFSEKYVYEVTKNHLTTTPFRMMSMIYFNTC